MASQREETKPTTNLLRKDNHHDKYGHILQCILDTRKTPHDAAVELDNLIFNKIQSQYETLKDRDPPFTLTEEEKKTTTLHLVGPIAIREENHFFSLVAHVVRDIPPENGVQDRLIRFIESLKSLPRRKLHNLNVSEGTLELEPMWGFGTEDVRTKVMCFQHEAELLWGSDPDEDGPGVEQPGSEVQIRWRNLQAFIARLCSHELIDLGDLSALEFLLPGYYMYNDWEEREDGPSRIEGDLIAAQYWLAEEKERQWVYEKCMKGEIKSYYRLNLWKQENWATWKSQMEFIATDKRFTVEARDLATSLKTKMEAQETSI